MTKTNNSILPRGEPKTRDVVENIRKTLKELMQSLGSQTYFLEDIKPIAKNVQPTQREETVLFSIGYRELYSRQIQQIIYQTTGKKLSEGSIYPILKSLTDKKLIEGRWGDEKSDCGARRRYYKLTAKGWAVIRKDINSRFELLFANITDESSEMSKNLGDE